MVKSKKLLPLWIIEDKHFINDHVDILKKTIAEQGMCIECVKYIPFSSGIESINDIDKIAKDHDSCVIFCGSLNLAHVLRGIPHWRPGAWCHQDNFDCDIYYAHLGRFLLNDDYLMLPLSELARRKTEVYDLFDALNIFIRPSAGNKTFRGQAIYFGDFDQKIEELDVPPETLVVVARALKITREWRLIVSKKMQGKGAEIVTGCQYRENFEHHELPKVPARVMDFARSIFDDAEWLPDPIFVADIGESGDGLGLIEINSFSCSGWYCSCISSIVKRATQLALEQKERNPPGTLPTIKVREGLWVVKDSGAGRVRDYFAKSGLYDKKKS